MSTEIATLLVSSPDVCDGRLRIDGTRTTVNEIVILYKKGHNAENIAVQYPHLTLAQIYAALAHYHANREDIEADLSAEAEEHSHANPKTVSLETERWLETFKELQRRVSLTPAKAAEWQNSIREARR